MINCKYVRSLLFALVVLVSIQCLGASADKARGLDVLQSMSVEWKMGDEVVKRVDFIRRNGELKINLKEDNMLEALDTVSITLKPSKMLDGYNRKILNIVPRDDNMLGVSIYLEPVNGNYLNASINHSNINWSNSIEFLPVKCDIYAYFWSTNPSKKALKEYLGSMYVENVDIHSYNNLIENEIYYYTKLPQFTITPEVDTKVAVNYKIKLLSLLVFIPLSLLVWSRLFMKAYSINGECPSSLSKPPADNTKLSPSKLPNMVTFLTLVASLIPIFMLFIPFKNYL